MSRGIKLLVVFLAFVVIYTVGHHLIESTTATTTTTTTTTTTSSSVTTSSPPGTQCLAQDFSGVYNEGEGAAGTVYASVTLTKSSAGTCTLKGWPRLTLQDKLGALLPSTTVDVPSSGNGFQFLIAAANNPPSTLHVGPNGTVQFSLAYSDVQSGTTACANAVSVNVQFVAGGDSIDVTPAYSVTPCNNGQILVSPFY